MRPRGLLLFFTAFAFAYLRARPRTVLLRPVSAIGFRGFFMAGEFRFDKRKMCPIIGLHLKNHKDLRAQRRTHPYGSASE